MNRREAVSNNCLLMWWKDKELFLMPNKTRKKNRQSTTYPYLEIFQEAKNYQKRTQKVISIRQSSRRMFREFRALKCRRRGFIRVPEIRFKVWSIRYWHLRPPGPEIRKIWGELESKLWVATAAKTSLISIEKNLIFLDLCSFEFIAKSIKKDSGH